MVAAHGLSLAAMRRLLIAVAPLGGSVSSRLVGVVAATHGLSSCGLQALGHVGFSGCGA